MAQRVQGPISFTVTVLGRRMSATFEGNEKEVRAAFKVEETVNEVAQEKIKEYGENLGKFLEAQILANGALQDQLEVKTTPIAAGAVVKKLEGAVLDAEGIQFPSRGASKTNWQPYAPSSTTSSTRNLWEETAQKVQGWADSEWRKVDTWWQTNQGWRPTSTIRTSSAPGASTEKNRTKVEAAATERAKKASCKGLNTGKGATERSSSTAAGASSTAGVSSGTAAGASSTTEDAAVVEDQTKVWDSFWNSRKGSRNTQLNVTFLVSENQSVIPLNLKISEEGGAGDCFYHSYAACLNSLIENGWKGMVEIPQVPEFLSEEVKRTLSIKQEKFLQKVRDIVIAVQKERKTILKLKQEDIRTWAALLILNSSNLDAARGLIADELRAANKNTTGRSTLQQNLLNRGFKFNKNEELIPPKGMENDEIKEIAAALALTNGVEGHDGLIHLFSEAGLGTNIGLLTQETYPDEPLGDISATVADEDTKFFVARSTGGGHYRMARVVEEKTE